MKVKAHGKVIAKHIIYAAPSQLKLLCQAATWFMDGTFKIVREPYVQLFDIHAFVSSGENVKQVPLVNVLMSRQQTVDYTAVFIEILKAISGDLVLKEAVLDFEQATWLGIRKVFPI